MFSPSKEKSDVAYTSRLNIGTTLLYLLYINDLPGVLHLTESLLFADDTSIFYSHNDPDELARVINEELEYIDLWMKVISYR
jgi:hypothetical protein